MILVKNRLKKLKNKYEDDEMLKQLKYSPPINDNFDFILDDTEYEDTATQFPDIKNNFTQTIKKDMADKETDTYDELNKSIGAYILQINSTNFKSKEVSRGELMAQARTLPIQQKRDERSSSSSSGDSEGFLSRNARRGVRLAELTGNAIITTFNVASDLADFLAEATASRQQENSGDEEVTEEVAEIPSGSNNQPTFTRERSRSRDSDTDSDDTDDEALGGRLLRRGASRSRSSTPEKRNKYPKGKK